MFLKKLICTVTFSWKWLNYNIDLDQNEPFRKLTFWFKNTGHIRIRIEWGSIAFVFEIVMTFGLVYTVYVTAVDLKKGYIGTIAPLANWFPCGCQHFSWWCVLVYQWTQLWLLGLPWLARPGVATRFTRLVSLELFMSSFSLPVLAMRRCTGQTFKLVKRLLCPR